MSDADGPLSIMLETQMLSAAAEHNYSDIIWALHRFEWSFFVCKTQFTSVEFDEMICTLVAKNCSDYSDFDFRCFNPI